MSEWQPISSAPERLDVLVWDGEVILVAESHPLREGKWIDQHGFYVEPTHWQPLPEPPK